MRSCKFFLFLALCFTGGSIESHGEVPDADALVTVKEIGKDFPGFRGYMFSPHGARVDAFCGGPFGPGQTEFWGPRTPPRDPWNTQRDFYKRLNPSLGRHFIRKPGIGTIILDVTEIPGLSADPLDLEVFPRGLQEQIIRDAIMLTKEAVENRPTLRTIIKQGNRYWYVDPTSGDLILVRPENIPAVAPLKFSLPALEYEVWTRSSLPEARFARGFGRAGNMAFSALYLRAGYKHGYLDPQGDRFLNPKDGDDFLRTVMDPLVEGLGGSNPDRDIAYEERLNFWSRENAAFIWWQIWHNGSNSLAKFREWKASQSE